jgi:hypothetical protein
MYSSVNSLSVNGDLTNSGNFYAVSANPAIRSVTLSAQDITNLAGGTITSIIPSAGLPGVSGAVSNIDLTLSATNNIVNHGTISSSGALTLSAGGSITSSGGVVSAGSNINMTTEGGNINLQGGNYLSQTFNLNAGTGSVDAQVGKITGQVNVDACNATVIANTKNLDIGTWNVSGDPVIANTGSIQLSNSGTNPISPTHGAPLVVVSGGDITGSGPLTIDTTSLNGDGGNVYLIAGAKFTSASNLTITGPSKTGGSVNLPSLSTIHTFSTSTTTGNGGNVEISAFAGSASGSGTINLSPSSTINTGAVGTGTPGHVFLIGGASTNSPTAFGVSAGAINSKGGNGIGADGLAGGDVVIATEQPNVSAKNPMVINPSSGQIMQGGILGGAIANSPVNLAAFIQTPGGQVIVLSGIGISSNPGDPGISTAAPSGVPGGMVTLIANASGKLPGASTINLTGIVTDSNTTSAGNVFIMAPASIAINGSMSISAQGNGGTASGGSVDIFGGGNGAAIIAPSINTTSANSNGGNVVIISASNDIGTSTNPIAITTAGYGTGSVHSGAITVSSSGNIFLANVYASSGGTAGSVFLSAGKAITATSVLTTSTGGNAGGIYALSAGGTAPNLGVVQQLSTTNTPNLEVANYTPSSASIGPNSTTAFTIDNGTAPSAFAPGGYTSINDQGSTAKGGAILSIAIQNDPGVIVPIVSKSATTPLTLLGSATAPSGVETDTHAGSNGASYILFSPAGISVGSANAFLTSIGAGSFAPILSRVAASSGTVTVNNANAFGQGLTVGTAASSNGPLSISAPGLSIVNALSAATPAKGASITLDALGLNSLTINGNITAAGGISLMPTGQGNISSNVTTNPYVIAGSSLSLGNSNLVGSLGSGSSAPTRFIFADVNSLTVTTNPNVQSNIAAIGSLEDMSVSFNVGGAFQLTGNNSVIVSASTAGQSATIEESDVQASAATAGISSPIVGLGATNTIGTASSPLVVSNLKTNTSPLLIQVVGTGTDFIKNSDKQGIEFAGASTAGALSAIASGNIILNGGPSITTTGSLTLRTGTAGGILSNGGSVLSATSLAITAGSQGIGFNGTPGNQVQLAGTLSSVQVVSAGGVRLFANHSLTLSGASSAGATSPGFTLIVPNGSIGFASTGAITAPSVFLDAGGGGTITQTSTTLPSINAANTTLLSSGIGGAIPIIIKGGNLTAQSNGQWNVQSISSITLVGASTTGTFTPAILLSGGAITFASGATLTVPTGSAIIEAKTGAITQKDPAWLPVVLSNAVTITADSGSIGTATNPLCLDTGFGSGAGTALSAGLSAPTGSVYVDGVADPSTGHNLGMNIQNSVAKTQAVITSVSSITFMSATSPALTAGGSATISSPAVVSDSGGGVDIATPSLSLTTGTTAGGAIKISNVTGNTSAPNVTMTAQSAFSLTGTAGINFVGTSTGAATLTITTTSGNINISKGASIADTNPAATLTLAATNGGNVTQSASGTDITAGTLALKATSVGSSAIPLGVTSGSPAAILLDTSACTKNVFIAAAGPAEVVGATTTLSGTFQLVTSGITNFGTIGITQNINAQTVTLKTLNNAGISISNAFGASSITATGTETINANGTGSILSDVTLLAKDLVLATGSGQIGSVTSGHLPTQATNTISANVLTGTTGSVNIQNSSSGTSTVTLLNSSAGASFTFINGTNVTVNSITTRSPLSLNNGNITVAGFSNVAIAAGSKITSNGGNIQIATLDNTATIDIGKGAHITTLAQGGGNGQILFVVGSTAPNPQPYTGPTIPGLTINTKNSAQVFLGSSTTPTPPAVCINVVGSGNVLNAFGQNIFFNTGSTNPKQITLEGGVVITADPLLPVGATTTEPAGDCIVDTDLDF